MTLIVVIEDEQDILDMLCYHLRRESFEVITAITGDGGSEMVRRHKPDLVLLDLMLPNKDGIQVCRELKANTTTKDIPVIMVTAKGEESDVVLGLGLGADDYVTKPFSPKELMARVHTVLRRRQQTQQLALQNHISQKDLEIDMDKHRVTCEGREVSLTATEFRLLHFLANHPGRVFSREQLLNQVVGDGVIVVDRNIDVHIRGIRKKLGKSDYIETIRGVGYRFRDSIAEKQSTN